MIWLYIYIDSIIWYKIILLWRFNNSQGQPRIKDDIKPTGVRFGNSLGMAYRSVNQSMPLAFAFAKRRNGASGGFEMVFQSSQSAWRKAGCKQGLSYSANQQSVSSIVSSIFHTTHKTPTLQRITKKNNSLPSKRRVLHLKSIASRQLVKDRCWWSELLHTCEEQFLVVETETEKLPLVTRQLPVTLPATTAMNAVVQLPARWPNSNGNYQEVVQINWKCLYDL